jgi:hypothetical protein
LLPGQFWRTKWLQATCGSSVGLGQHRRTEVQMKLTPVHFHRSLEASVLLGTLFQTQKEDVAGLPPSSSFCHPSLAYLSSPDWAMTTFFLVLPDCEPRVSMFLTTSIPSTTRPLLRLRLVGGVRNESLASKSPREISQNDVLSVEPSGRDSADEELRAVGVRASVGHRENTLSGVLEGEVLKKQASV